MAKQVNQEEKELVDDLGIMIDELKDVRTMIRKNMDMQLFYPLENLDLLLICIPNIRKRIKEHYQLTEEE